MFHISYRDQPIPEPYKIYIHNFDFERFLEYANEDIDCELLDGVLLIKSPVSLNHELIFKFLLTFLELYTSKNQLGLVLGSRFTMKLSSKWAPEPDIIFIQNELKGNLKENYLDGPASAVFEILSPTTKDDDLNKKVPKYVESGIKEIWIIDPAEESLKIVDPDGNAREFRPNEWAKSIIIKGFKLLPDWLWAIIRKENIDVLEKLKEIA